MLVFILTLALVLSSSWADDLIVKINAGKIRGSEKQSTDGSTFLAFSGIPYAKAPVGNLRFKSPEPASPWSDVLNATTPGSSCIQYYTLFNTGDPVVGDEDCLFLNVYTKQLSTSSGNSKKLVIVYIHGGAFMIGTGSPQNAPPEIIMNRDVVLVTINYRLGIFGFLSTASKHLPGNYGLKDQALALKWVKENIQHFSGDSSKITIFGGSAGGASVHYQMLSPLTKGLFERAYAASGTALCPWAYVNNDLAQTNAKKLAHLVECPDTLDQKMVDCFMKKDAKELVGKVPDFGVLGGLTSFPITPFGPTVELEGGDERFLPDIPYEIIRQGKVHDVPFMTGFTKEEGILFIFFLANPIESAKFINHFSELLPKVLDYGHTTDSVDDVTQRIKKYYIGDELNEDVIKDVPKLAQLFSDRIIVHGVYEAVQLQLQSTVSSPIYVYQFNQHISNNFMAPILQAWGIAETAGAAHGEDASFIIPFIPLEGNFSTEDQIVSDLLLDHLIAFGETGNPNYDGSEYKWPSTSRNFEFLDITLKPTVKSNFPHPKMEFWRSLPITTGGKKHKERGRDEL